MNIDHRQYDAMVKLSHELTEVLQHPLARGSMRCNLEMVKDMLIPPGVDRELGWDIWRWAYRHKPTTDFAMYSAESWAARHESVGMKAVFTITCEGAPLRVLYYDEADTKAKEEFDEIVGKHGFYYEWGYHWSMHFYKLEH